MVIFSIALFFFLGYLFKTYYSYSEDQVGQMLSRIILNVTLPATIFISASNTGGFSQAIFLPVAAFCLQVFMLGIFYFLARRFRLEQDTECVFLTTPLMTNTLLFMAPFFYLTYGDQGLARIILYDMGNAVTIYFIAQAIFILYGQGKFNFLYGLKKIITSIPLWAFFLGLLFGGLHLTIPQIILDPLLIMKEVNIFLPMFLLGFYFRPSLEKIRLVMFTVFFRMLLGLLAGIGISFFFPNPIDKVTLIMGASAPIGLMSLIFSSEYKKDTRFSSGIVSYSMIGGLVLTFVLDLVFKSIGWI